MNRCTKAHDGVSDRVLSELKNGRKRSHWMWYIFPQIDGLGRSSTSKYYAIKSLEEAREYFTHPLLGARLVECALVLLALEDLSARQIFGSTASRKLKPCMTLLARVAESDSVFERVLNEYFQGKRDARTLKLLEISCLRRKRSPHVA